MVGVSSSAKVVGWVHAFASRLVESDPHAEIGGLVVNERFRGRGVGKLLLRHAERWARQKDLSSIYLRSNVIRKGAHVFYESLGYQNIKTQHAFRKAL
jgi:GNAT superfamily N-acetyltransferase